MNFSCSHHYLLSPLALGWQWSCGYMPHAQSCGVIITVYCVVTGEISLTQLLAAVQCHESIS